MSIQIPQPTPRRRWWTSMPLLAALVMGGGLLTGCSVAHDLHKVVGALEADRSTIDAFTGTISSKATAAFAVTYTTTGTAPSTVHYATDPPHGLAFSETPSGAGTVPSTDVIVNPAGEYACTAASTAGSAPAWSCQQLPKVDAATENKIFTFYTPSHWVSFLRDLALTAGLAGDKVSSSSMTLNGFAMKCVDFVAKGVAGTSTICTTSQGILGYVKVAGDPTSFEITAYSSTPAASLFELPAGATLTPVTTPTT